MSFLLADKQRRRFEQEQSDVSRAIAILKHSLIGDSFMTRELEVERNLLGLLHEFSYGCSIVRVELPSSDYLDRDEPYKAACQVISHIG